MLPFDAFLITLAPEKDGKIDCVPDADKHVPAGGTAAVISVSRADGSTITDVDGQVIARAIKLAVPPAELLNPGSHTVQEVLDIVAHYWPQASVSVNLLEQLLPVINQLHAQGNLSLAQKAALILHAIFGV